MDINCWKVPNDLNKILTNEMIVTRFPPENSGYLHIGHVKALMINYVIAKKYNGKFILRYDDTNPTTETLEFQNAIHDDIGMLNIIPDQTTHSSDYFPQLIDYAEYLLTNNLAYVDNTSKATMKIERKHCVDSKNRNNSVKDNLDQFYLMRDGLVKDSCIRIKFNMKHPTANCRDPTIFRSIDTEHPTTGDRYHIYPTYDFACPIIDSLELVTHAFRSVEYSDRHEQYYFILDLLKLRKPKLFCYGKVKFTEVILSKRKIKTLIDNDIVSSWDDPRLFTLRGLMNRGIHLSALNQFVSTLGFSSKTPPVMTPDKLWTMNKKTIDMIASRYICLPLDCTAIKINGFTINKEIPKYIKNPTLGSRLLYCSNTILIDTNDYNALKDDDEVSLLLWGNAYVSNNELLLNDRDFKLSTKKLLWLSDYIDIKINHYSNYDCNTFYYFGESALLNLNKGDYVQFLKMSYYMCTDVDIDNRIVSFVQLN